MFFTEMSKNILCYIRLRPLKGFKHTRGRSIFRREYPHERRCLLRADATTMSGDQQQQHCPSLGAHHGAVRTRSDESELAACNATRPVPFLSSRPSEHYQHYHYQQATNAKQRRNVQRILIPPPYLSLRLLAAHGHGMSFTTWLIYTV